MKRRRIVILLFSALSLFLLSACASPTVAYFPVRQDLGPSPLALNSGKLVFEDGCLRLAWFGDSWLLIWPNGYSYQISGDDIEIQDENTKVVAHTGQFIQLGGGEVPSVQYLTGVPPPSDCTGPYWLVGPESIKNLYPWSLGMGPGFLVITAVVLMLATIIVWLIMRRRAKRATL